MPHLSDERLDHFMRAAIGCFARYGYRRTSMDTIARAADVSRPALYQYFRNKEEVFRAAAGWGLGRVAAQAENEAAAPGTAQERLQAVLLLVLDMHQAHGHRRPGGEFHAELVDETYARANDVWQAFEARLLASLRTVLEQHADRLDPSSVGMTTDDATLVLLYGAKGIALHANEPSQAARSLLQLIAVTVRGIESRASGPAPGSGDSAAT